ncbi:MAG: transcriptional regulator [Kofleriaceae bacterium]
MTIRPIRTEHDHGEAVARIEQIVAAKPGTPEFDELDVLATLVDAYEREHHPIDPPSPIEAIKFRMDQGQFTRADLVKLLGSSAKVTEVLQRKRALSKVMIVRIHRRFAIPYDALLGDIEGPPMMRTRRAATKSKKESKPARRASR